MSEETCGCNFCVNGVRDGLGHDDGPADLVSVPSERELRQAEIIIAAIHVAKHRLAERTFGWNPTCDELGCWMPTVRDFAQIIVDAIHEVDADVGGTLRKRNTPSGGVVSTANENAAHVGGN